MAKLQYKVASGQVNGSKQFSFSFDSAVTAGSLLIIGTNANSAISNEVSTITDSLGNTWNRAEDTTEASFCASSGWYCYNAAAGTPTVTITTATASTFLAVVAQEHSGIQTTADPLDKHSSASSAASSSLSSGTTASLSQADELVVAIGGINSGTARPLNILNAFPPANLNVDYVINATDGETCAIVTKIVQDTAAQLAIFNWSASGHTNSIVMTFKRIQPISTAAWYDA